MPEWKKKNLDDVSKKIEEVVYMEILKNGGECGCFNHASINNICLCLFEESQVMLSEKMEDTVQIPMESSKPDVQTQKSHDPRWVHTRLREKSFTFLSVSTYARRFWVRWSVFKIPVHLTCWPLPNPQITQCCLPYLFSSFSLPLVLRCDPSDINISDEMSKTTVWQSLSSNQKDIRPVAAKKARPFPLFLTTVTQKFYWYTMWSLTAFVLQLAKVQHRNYARWHLNSGFVCFNFAGLRGSRS